MFNPLSPTINPAMKIIIFSNTIASLAQATGFIIMAKSINVLSVLVDQPCRLRLYSTAAARTADLARSTTIPPTPGTQHGVIMDLVLSTAAVGSFPATWLLSPAALGNNDDSPPSSNIYYTVDNLTAVATAINITVTFLPKEL
jgi:hypothetical protein